LSKEEADVCINIEGGLTDPGIGTLLKGDIDMAGDGRHLIKAEKSKGLVEHFIGSDVLCVVINHSNSIDDFSKDQLQKVFTGEIQNCKELGGPDQVILHKANQQASLFPSTITGRNKSLVDAPSAKVIKVNDVEPSQ
jgi:phosphate transport system substrate-binding protein